MKKILIVLRSVCLLLALVALPLMTSSCGRNSQGPASKPKQYTAADVAAVNGQGRYALYYANKELAKLNYSDYGFADQLEIFDQAVVKYHKGKYYQNLCLHREPSPEADQEDWSKAVKYFTECENLAQAVHNALVSGMPPDIDVVPEKLKILPGTETTFADEVPIMSAICPVVILSGSDYDMGYQYAQQLTKIYGPWLLEQRAGRNFSEEQLNVLCKWEEQIEQYAPEMIDFFKGWVAGANADGIPMSYNDVLELWVGPQPPATEPVTFPQLDGMCSGVCAWGSATTDGELVAAGFQDMDGTFPATIVAFPETGNNFIYTPFSARGTIENAGDFYFAGLPGMNNKGVAYVHHGGAVGTKCEPKEDWGYGIRRGVFTFHALRFADDLDEAEDMIFSSPIGDVGTMLGSVGGFFADNSSGFAVECRKDPVAVRRAGLMGETDFLYATNNILHPDLVDCLPPPIEAMSWDTHAGWHTLNPVPGGGTVEEFFRQMASKHSHCRNLYFFHMLDQYKGGVDVEFMKMLSRQNATLPPGTLEEIEAAWMEGAYWPCSPAHPANAFVGLMKPDDGDEGLYYGCIGPAARDTEPAMGPGSFYYYPDDPYAFWELKLAGSPAEVAEAAKERAEADLNAARAELAKLYPWRPAFQPLDKIFNQACSEFVGGGQYEVLARHTTGNESIYNWAKATRAFTRCQVRARQVYNALVPPPDSPDDLGLEPFVWPEVSP